MSLHIKLELENTLRSQLTRLTESYFLEAQDIPVKDDFTFETDSGKTAFLSHNGDIILDGKHYDFIDWLNENFRSKRSAIIQSLSTFLHLKKSKK